MQAQYMLAVQYYIKCLCYLASVLAKAPEVDLTPVIK